MLMIDLYAPDDLFPAGTDRQLAEELTSAFLRAEGVFTPSAAHLAIKKDKYSQFHKDFFSHDGIKIDCCRYGRSTLAT